MIGGELGMIGGLFKSASRVALVAAAGVLMGGVAAQAADLGGNCCADLEERVAELEATTARKGNRKVSLTVYGLVNESILFWDDGAEKNAYVTTGSNSRTRFGFKGDAKINADLSAGFLFEIGNRRNDSGAVTQSTDLVSKALDVRHEALYLDSKTFGRVWLGHTSSAADGITEINLGGTAATAFDRSSYLAAFTTKTGLTWNVLAARGDGDWSSDENRRDIIRYISPTIAGFTASTSWGADDYWDVALRYATEVNGFRFAAGGAYWKTTSENDIGWAGANTATTGGCLKTTVGGDPSKGSLDCEGAGASASLMHVQTGLFVSGAYSQLTDNNVHKVVGKGMQDTDKSWYVTAGIQKNWFGLGATTLYGEYGNYDKGAFSTYAASTYKADGSGKVTGWTKDDFSGSTVDMFSIGVNQTIDAAALDLYAFYSQYSGDATTKAGKTTSADDLQMVVMGAMIKF